jgi:hypothetical protein
VDGEAVQNLRNLLKEKQLVALLDEALHQNDAE